MCGRFAFTKNGEEVKKRFGLTLVPPDLTPRWNIAPSQNVPVILNESPDRLSWVRWGLVPFWAPDEKTGYRLINARAETVTEKPSFRQAVKARRCLILADAFYEWKKEGRRKRPFRVSLKDDGMFAFAGIWETWNKTGTELRTCAILTVEANPLVRTLHERMPVILPPSREREWLRDPGGDRALDLLKPLPPGDMKMVEISAAINSPASEGAELIRPVTPRG